VAGCGRHRVLELAPERAGGFPAGVSGGRRIDWDEVARELDERGHARLPRLLGARECARIARLYDDVDSFRSFVDMGAHRFGEGEYRYFANPLPPLVRELRESLYPPLAEIANRWQQQLGSERRFPKRLRDFLGECADAGQLRPTPLLLRYGTGGFNNLHQDRYGDVAFPLQVVVLLSRSSVDQGRDGRPADFTGGEFLLVEQRPRQQARGEVIALARGEAVVFPNAERPVQGVRGAYRAQVRHGVSRLHSGGRTTLGLIFHDAR
jgi:hypothetical protein